MLLVIMDLRVTFYNRLDGGQCLIIFPIIVAILLLMMRFDQIVRYPLLPLITVWNLIMVLWNPLRTDIALEYDVAALFFGLSLAFLFRPFIWW